MKKIIPILICSLLLINLVGCGNFQKGNSNTQKKILTKTDIEGEIKSQISIADKQANNKDYLNAFGTLQKVKDKYELDKNDYDGLGKLIAMKQTEYDITHHLESAIKLLNKKDYYNAKNDVGYLFEKYPNSMETKNKLIPLITKIAEEEFSNGNFDIMLSTLLGVGNSAYDGKESRIANIFVKYNKEIGSLSRGLNMNISDVTIIQPSIKEPTLNMSTEEVKKSTWGEPTHIDKITNEFGNYEIWYYSSAKAIWFKDGHVTDIYDQIK